MALQAGEMDVRRDAIFAKIVKANDAIEQQLLGRAAGILSVAGQRPRGMRAGRDGFKTGHRKPLKQPFNNLPL
jgi:hypothetical protein